jgi:hypothetical protein
MGISDARLAPNLGVETGPTLWIPAVLFYGFGDLVTTLVGLDLGVATEASPFASILVAQHGIGFIYVAKLSALGLFYLLWTVTPRPHRDGIPLGLCLVGVAVTVWNTWVLLAGLGSL